MNKVTTILLLLAISSSSWARLYNYCEGTGSFYNSNTEIFGSFKINDSAKVIDVNFENSVNAIYKIIQDGTSSSYRPGEQRVLGEYVKGATPYGKVKYITVWIPNTSYYDSIEGSMTFSQNWYTDPVASHVLMTCSSR